jgi:hypothetical protein
MSKQNSEPNIDDIEYGLLFLRKPKWILALLIMLNISIIGNIPTEDKIDDLIYSLLASNSSCPITMSGYEINLFPLPHFNLKGLSVPSKCLGPGKPSLRFPSIKAYIRGPSLFPLGGKFKIEAQYKKNPIELFATLGLSNMIFELEENQLDLEHLNDFIPMVKLSGKALVDAYVELKDGKLETLNMKVQSNDFLIPGQSLAGMFTVKPLKIKNLFLSVTTEAKRLKINKFIIGDEVSPVRSEFTGTIKINARSLKASNLDLVGQVSFSDEFLKEIFILETYMKQFDKRDNFYQIKINGPLSRPSLKSKR